MPVAVRDLPQSAAEGMQPRGSGAVRLLLLARLVGERAVARAEVLRDVAGLISHRLSPGEFRDNFQACLDALIASGFGVETRGRLSLTETGRSEALAQLEAAKLPADWGEVRDVLLVGRALGLGNLTPRHLKLLSRPDGLRGAIVRHHFALKAPLGASAARVRGQLAVVALERAFGNKLKGGIDAGAGLPAKMSRMLAAQLLRKPRELGTDGRLLAALAAECVGATRPTVEAVRSALLRRYIAELVGGPEASPADSRRGPAAREQEPAQAPARNRNQTVPRPPAANRPDLAGFVAEVNRAAGAHADGWPGNRKAYVCHVWREIAARFPEWGLSEIEFKSMLAEAHRTGHLVLVNADLRDKRDLAELQASAIAYKNTVWHFVRLQD